MKKRYLFFLLILLFTGLLQTMGQGLNKPVRFANGDLITGDNISRQNFTPPGINASLFAGNYFVLIQFVRLPGEATKKNLRAAGIELHGYLSSNAYLATVKSSFDFSKAAGFTINSINNLPTLYKLDVALAAKNNISPDKTIAVAFYSSLSRSFVENELQKLGAQIVTGKFKSSPLIFIRANAALIDPIAQLPFISSLNLQGISDKPLNYVSTAMHGIGGLQLDYGRNLNGKGIVTGVGDNGEVETVHRDFTNRVINRVPFPVSFHAIHVSGTVMGAGIMNPKYKGMAPKSTLLSQYFSDVVTNTPVYWTDYNMVATNNSYTAADDSCAGTGVYDALSNYVDNQLKQLPKMLHIFAAGNDGRWPCAPYPDSFATVKSGWQSAKNVLSVGAIDADYKVAFFSSRGPVKDGRIKPEIVARGLSQISTNHVNGYSGNSGTSMASPVVAGAYALLNEAYRLKFSGALPDAALMKALLCNSAEDLGKPGPDYTYGFGMLNARRAVEALEANQFFTGSSNTLPSTHTIAIPTGVRRLKVMLYWPDTAALPNAASALINDLDLTVTDPAAGIHLPLVLDATPANVRDSAEAGADHVNNIEQVVIEDPVAGNYDISVAAFAVPQGPQPYVLAYQMDRNGITVEYPFGGETLVPGEAESIRWTAFGDEAETFTVEYSDNNGVAWTTISNNVAGNLKSLAWTVPAGITNQALVRVSRNSSTYTDKSDSTFVVLGQPLVTASVPCEGFTQLSWPAITGATSYDILQLQGDSMGVIGNTTSLTYLVSGLNATNTYWFGVRAKNNAVAGRRSLTVSSLPATGTCTLGNFDNNFKAVAITGPATGRQFSTGALTASEQVRLMVKNLDNIASSGSYDLYYQVNSDPAVMESSSFVIAALGSNTHSFAATNAFANPGIYNIKAWVKRTGDVQPLDDTTFLTIKNLANPPLALPVLDDFETTDSKTYTVNTIGLDGNDKADFKTNSIRGRARTFVNSGFANSGNRAVTLDQFPVNAALTTDSLLMTYNVATYDGNQLRFDFAYKNHGQVNNPNNKVWIRGDDTKPWIFAYDLHYNQAGIGQYRGASINVNDVLDTVSPAQPIGTSFQIKFAQQGNTSANNPNPDLDQDDGYTFDDVQLAAVTNDIGIIEIVNPAINGCNQAGSQTVSIKVKNYSATTFTNVPVTYELNGSPVNETIALLPPGVTVFNFTTPAVLTNNTAYTMNFWLHENSDTYPSNDSILNYRFHTSSVISSFPYLEGFESGTSGYYTGGQNSSWQWGTPNKTIITKAANGTKAWATNLTGRYADRELSYLYSPCFDLSTLTAPVLSFSHIFRIEDATPADYTWVEYSTNGVTWSKLGTNGAGTNWYNDPTGAHQWRTSLPTWHVASIDIPVKVANVRFRFVMSSNEAYGSAGVGIDDIHVFDKQLIHPSGTVTGITQPVSGSNWVHFISAGRRVASINANGFNLGATTVDVYPFAGTVRTWNNQYYLNRNIVIRPQFQPAGYTSVRFYFTDAEAKSLLAANTCGTCTKPKDPYELGVTKYSGPAVQENGTLSDNFGGAYSYILPANTEIIPYDNGYYAEFPVNSYSEFWLNNGGITGTQPLPITLLSFEALQQNKSSLLLWTTENELNAARYSIERSVDGNTYFEIGSVPAVNSGNRLNYNFTDPQPATGWNYYRLRMIDRDGSYKYSPVRKLYFNGSDAISVYPNPLVDGRLTIRSAVTVQSAVLSDAAGRIVKTFTPNSVSPVLNLTGIAKGLYQLKITTAHVTHIEKIIVP